MVFLLKVLDGALGAGAEDAVHGHGVAVVGQFLLQLTRAAALVSERHSRAVVQVHRR